VNWGTVIGLVIAGASALAGIVGAVVSVRSASASKSSSRAAREAHAIAIKPQLRADAFGTVGPTREGWKNVVVVTNNAQWNALDVDVEIHLRDGRDVKKTSAVLRPILTAGGAPTTESFEVEYGEVALSKSQDENPVERVFVRYWDAQRIRRYELRTFFSVGGFRREEEQIEGL
jgi:hypothetical protein